MLVFRFAVATAIATLFLLGWGGAVNPSGSSLACPEAWFICKGTMFPHMAGGVFFEHGHRMVAMTVGLLQTGLTLLIWRYRRDLLALGILAWCQVSMQGVLGALTVQYQLPVAVSTAHLMNGMLYLAVLIYICLRARPVRDAGAGPAVLISPRLRGWIGVAALATYAQISLGAVMRHTGSFLASTDLPFHHGQLWPEGAALRIHMAHRLLGVVVGLLVIGVAVAAVRGLRERPRLQALGVVAGLLVIAQVALGVLTIWTLRSSLAIVVAHVGVAAALWGTLVWLWLGTRHGALRKQELSAGVRMDRVTA